MNVRVERKKLDFVLTLATRIIVHFHPGCAASSPVNGTTPTPSLRIPRRPRALSREPSRRPQKADGASDGSG